MEPDVHHFPHLALYQFLPCPLSYLIELLCEQTDACGRPVLVLIHLEWIFNMKITQSFAIEQSVEFVIEPEHGY